MHVCIQILILIGLLYSVWQYQELKKFRVTPYQVVSGKVREEIRLAVIADLHSFSYGKDNKRLIRALQMQRPDLILIPGDLIVTSRVDKYAASASFAQEIVKIAPVIYSNGNHESRAELPDYKEYPAYRAYRRRLEEAGVLFLNNASLALNIRNTKLRVSGLEVPLPCYEKKKKMRLEKRFLHSQLGDAATDRLQLLLAHNPEFADQYAEWGADITVCGHNHGGLVNIPGIGSIISSQLIWFPEFDAGEFAFGKRRVYISRGLGTHTFHIRIFNRAELLAITVKPPDTACQTS